jgi:hypothetical protein
MINSKAKCPKCGSLNLKLVECWKDHTIDFEQHGGFVNINDGALEPGEPYKVEAKCNCGHKWRLRNVLQIGDITK